MIDIFHVLFPAVVGVFAHQLGHRQGWRYGFRWGLRGGSTVPDTRKWVRKIEEEEKARAGR